MATPNTHFGALEIGKMLDGTDAIYFLGIGGVSMSSLAALTARRGVRVGGFDRAQSTLTDALAARGIPVDFCPSADHIDGYGAVVYTVAIREDQPEYVEARRRGIPLISRADYLGYLMTEYKNRIGFAGTHGKSTASLMCSCIFMEAEEDPTVLVGATMPSIGGAFRAGGKEHMVFEACEYMDSFLDFNPSVAVVLNIEMDHVDYFRNMEQMRASYRAFAERTGESGTVIFNADDAECPRAFADCRARAVTFGVREDADYRAIGISVENGYPSFTIAHHGEPLCRVKLNVPGKHNVYNALAAAAAARECGICSRRIAAGLEAFEGAGRRMERRGEVNGAAIFDDYGHHPTEVRATLEAARQLGTGRLICAFQPHTYSRTAALFDDYVSALRQADEVIVTPVYAARETETLGVNEQKLAAAIGQHAMACAALDEVTDRIRQTARPGDTVIVMGAGNIGGIIPSLIETK